jgi:hypothetical protein
MNISKADNVADHIDTIAKQRYPDVSLAKAVTQLLETDEGRTLYSAHYLAKAQGENKSAITADVIDAAAREAHPDLPLAKAVSKFLESDSGSQLYTLFKSQQQPR